MILSTANFERRAVEIFADTGHIAVRFLSQVPVVQIRPALLGREHNMEIDLYE
jgi:hypothetical protein